MRDGSGTLSSRGKREVAILGDGTFGLQREQTIADSKVRDVFTPYAPIDVVDHFFGREKEVAHLVSVINSPGQHVLLYGDRGVGKTSLAKITCTLVQRSKVSTGRFFTRRCDSEDSFASLLRDPLRYVGYDYQVSEETEEQFTEGGGKVSLGVAEGGGKRGQSTLIKRVPEYQAESPAWVAEKLKRLKALFLIDEADSLSRKTDRKKIAQLMKLLSDEKSEFTIMVVGIAETGEDLMAGHQSVERCLKETHLSRMTDGDLRDIVRRGMEKLKLSPTDAVVDRIVSISSGYPHFTHLICLKCAESAIVDRRGHIGIDHLQQALRDSVEESEGALKRRYDATLRGCTHAREYVAIMRAAASCGTHEFGSQQIQDRLEGILSIEIPRKTLSRYMSNMVCNGSRGVFNRISKGVYKFADPRMPSFVRMAEAQD